MLMEHFNGLKFVLDKTLNRVLFSLHKKHGPLNQVLQLSTIPTFFTLKPFFYAFSLH